MVIHSMVYTLLTQARMVYGIVQQTDSVSDDSLVYIHGNQVTMEEG